MGTKTAWKEEVWLKLQQLAKERQNRILVHLYNCLYHNLHQFWRESLSLQYICNSHNDDDDKRIELGFIIKPGSLMVHFDSLLVPNSNAEFIAMKCDSMTDSLLPSLGSGAISQTKSDDFRDSLSFLSGSTHYCCCCIQKFEKTIFLYPY